MDIYFIGTHSEVDRTVDAFAKEDNHNVKYSGYISSSDKLKKAVNAASAYNVAIIDIADINGVDDSTIKECIKSLINNCKTRLICYCPSGATSKGVKLCEEIGVEYFICDYLGMDIKRKLKMYISQYEDELEYADAYKQLNNSKQEQLQFQSQKQSIIKNESQYIQQTIPTEHQPIYSSNYANENLRETVQTQPIQSIAHLPETQEKNRLVKKKYNLNSSNSDDDVFVTKTVGVIGIMPRIGTTTQAVQITRFLSELGFKACYVQYHSSRFLDDMQEYFTGVEIDSDTECLYYDNLDFYKSKNQVFGLNYEYNIFDYGSVDNIPSDFFDKDIRIVVCGGTAEEVEYLTNLVPHLYDDYNIKYIFSFVADYEKNDVYEMMGDKKTETYFAPYSPDCFTLQEESKEMLCKIFNIDVPEQKKNKKRKRGK